MVCRLADYLWVGSRMGRHVARQDSHRSIDSVGAAHGTRGDGNTSWRRPGGKGGAPGMNVRRFRDGVFALCSLFFAGCNHSPGTPRVNAEQVRPEEIKDFSILYAHNCSACHGRDGQNGPAIALANSIYQAIVDDDRLRSVIASGDP